MSAWADINIVFGGGWQPSELEIMSLEELSYWWELASERNNKQ